MGKNLQEGSLVNVKQWLATILVCCAPVICAGQEKQQTKPESAQSQPPARPAESTAAQHGAGMNKEEAQAMQADIQRMRVLIHQMQNNLGFVTSAQDPLKHEFELEIQMWQILLNQMERRTQIAGGK
jgi:hypothetical protein